MGDFVYEDDDVGFVGYEETTVDPGASMLVATTIFCALSLASLPVLMCIKKNCDRRRGGTPAGSSTDSATPKEEAVEGKGLTTLKTKKKREVGLKLETTATF